MIIHIITRCTRPENLLKLKDSIFGDQHIISVSWNILFDTNVIKDIDAELLHSLSHDNRINIYFTKNDGWGLSVSNDIIEKLSIKYPDSWIYFLDDDNILHENFLDRIYEVGNETYKRYLIVNQHIGYRDFTGLNIREAKPENVKVKGIDLAQYVIHIDMFFSLDSNGIFSGFRSGYTADGEFIEKLFKKYPNEFEFIPEILSYYNYLQKNLSARIPKILYIGPGKPNLKSSKHFSEYTQDLNVKYLENDHNINKEIALFDPDAIVVCSDLDDKYPILNKMGSSITKRIIYVDQHELIHTDVGHMSYQKASSYILNQENDYLISYFTPMFNTGEKLKNTYKSLISQTSPDWEWVLLNDSTDNGRTLNIAEELASQDYRIKVYDIREKTGGNIGEAKYRAAMLTHGHILAELDHDDIITPELTSWLQKASDDHPECGFFYTDCSTPTPNWENRWFQGSFSFDYGSYRDEEYQGHLLKVVNQHNINPVTIRHIVGIPNHIRAWRRETYFKLGGHRRRLSIADDYELVVRTFLETRMCHIPKLGYIQFMYDGDERNTHDIVRADIQRRVKSIAIHYHKMIKDRFDELGLHDWAYERDPNDPTASWYSPWPKGIDEQSATIKWKER